MVVSMDFDGSLNDSKELQEYAKELVQKNIPVVITTRRGTIQENDEWNINFPEQPVVDLAQDLGIKNINFLSGQMKYEFFKGKKDQDIIHIDDDLQELAFMAYHRDVKVFGMHQIQQFKDYINERIQQTVRDN